MFWFGEKTIGFRERGVTLQQHVVTRFSLCTHAEHQLYIGDGVVFPCLAGNDLPLQRTGTPIII